MDPKRIVALVVGASVMVLIFSALLVPIINDATTTTHTFTNNGYYKMSEVGEDAISISWDHTAPTELTVNDETVDLSAVPTNKLTTVVVTDMTIIRYAPVSSGTLIQVYSDSGYFDAGVTAGTDMEITIEAGTLTATNGTTTISKTITSGYYASNDGMWIMKLDGSPAYVHKDDSIIVLAGSTKVGTPNVGVYADGTINDGLDITTVQLDSVVRTPTYGDPTFNYSDVAGYIDLVSLSNCQFTITLDDTTVNATYSYFLVPVEVTAEMAVHPDDATRALLSAIPIIAMIGIVLAVVGVAIVGRNDY